VPFSACKILGLMATSGERAAFKLDYISPSALETFTGPGLVRGANGCARKWAWRKLDKIEIPPSGAAALGSEMHGHHERWLRDGTPYDRTTYAGELAAVTYDAGLLPPRETQGLEIEVERRIKVAGIALGGRIDVTWPGVVLDHKSTGDQRWAKLSREQLLGHPQAPIYALIEQHWHGTLETELRWNYAVKSKPRPKALPSWHKVTVQEAYDAVSPWLEPAALIVATVKAANDNGVRARHLPFNAGACEAYGGCPYRSNCNLSRQEIIENMTTPNDAQSFMARLAQIQGLPGPTQAPAPTTQAPIHFGGQINPPESVNAVLNAAPVQATPPLAPEPANDNAAPAAPAEPKRRGRPKKEVGAQEDKAPTPITPAEAPSCEVAERRELEDNDLGVLYSVTAGICANPVNGAASAEQIAGRVMTVFAAIKKAAL
jgi:hypothetical protein